MAAPQHCKLSGTFCGKDFNNTKNNGKAEPFKFTTIVLLTHYRRAFDVGKYGFQKLIRDALKKKTFLLNY